MNMLTDEGGKPLIITGRICYPSISKLTREFEISIYEVPIDVAALLTANDVIDAMKDIDLEEISYVMLPGMFRGDIDALQERFQIPFFLGPTNFVDIPLVVSETSIAELSKTVPADRQIADHKRKEVLGFYRDARRRENQWQGEPLIIGHDDNGVSIGRGCPPALVAEVVDAPRKDVKDILKECRHYLESGADIIDMGMIPREDNSKWITSTIPEIKAEIQAAISIDTMSEKEILAANDHQADLILSICGSTIDLVPSIDLPFVLVPVDDPQSKPPDSSQARVEKLKSYLKLIGNRNVILDPLLAPIGTGFYSSIKSYLKLEEELPKFPSLMGIGNVTELIDVDSIGINAVLAALALKANTSLILTTENSQKCRNSLSELSTALAMIYYSQQKKIVPKNMGLNLLRYKEKRKRIDPTPLAKPEIKAGKGKQKTDIDRNIKFHILLRNKRIHVLREGEGDKIHLSGNSAMDICFELDRQELLPGPAHSVYLGRELAKAETALKTGRSYIQDQNLFTEVDES